METTYTEVIKLINDRNKMQNLRNNAFNKWLRNSTYKEDIEKSGVKSLADFLQNRASVQVGRNGGIGGVTSFFLRGSESRNVLVLLNGVRLRDELTQSSLAENIPLDLVERIEVIPGNLSSVYGEGAIGGVINISTTKASYSVDERANKLIRLETGSYGTKNISFNIDTPVDDSLTILISGNLLQTNGFSATNPNQTFSSDPTDSDNDKHKNETRLEFKQKGFLPCRKSIPRFDSGKP